MNFFKYLIAGVLSLTPLSVLAEVSPSGHVVISEVQTGSSVSASYEFVELYNPTGAAVNLEGWVIEYKSASSANIDSSWTKKATMTGSIPAHGFYLVAPMANIAAANSEWSSGLASSAGNIRLRSADNLTIDQLGYGEAANAAELSPASTPGSGQSLERLPGLQAEQGGNGTDTDNNSADFIVRDTPDPQSTVSSPEAPEASQAPSVEEPAEESESQPAAYAQVIITELLIDPQAPLTDAEDEFIEIHNPDSQPAVITGYSLRAGTGLKGAYVLPETIIEPGGFMVFYSVDTHLSLVNSGGLVQILDPAGGVVDQTAAYPDAEPGLTWALNGGSWDWTLQSTPGLANVYVAPLISASASKSAVAKKATVKTAKAPKKVAAKKAATAKKPKTTKVKAASASKPSIPMAKNFQPANWLIALLIGLTITYAIYEFRYDIQNLYRRARGNR